MRNILIPIIGACILLGAAGVLANDSDTTERIVLAVVNSDTIFVSEMDEMFMQTHLSMNKNRKGNFDYRKLMDKVINDRLIIQEAGALGLDQEEWLIDILERSRQKNAIRQFVADRYKPDLEIAEKDILEYFRTNYAKLQIRTVSVSDSGQAETLVAEILNGASMDSIANAVSTDMYRYKGGLHNLKIFGDVENDLRAQTLKLKPGQLSQVFPYRQVYSFLRIEKSMPADTTELDTYRKKIKSVLQIRQQEMDWADFIDSLMIHYPIKIDSVVFVKVIADSARLFSPDFTKSSDDAVMTGEGDYSFSERELRKIVSRVAMEKATFPFYSVLQEGLTLSEEEFVLRMAANEGGYHNHPEVVNKYTHSLDSSLIEVYIKETVVSRIKFNHAEFDAYYNEHLEDFREAGDIQVGQLEILDEKIANEIEKRLSAGADFDFIAKEYEPSEQVNQEETQWISLLAFPPKVQNDLEQLDIGETSPAFPTITGYMIFHVYGRRPGRIQEMGEVEMQIREVMFQRKFDEYLNQTMAVLKENSFIEYNKPAIENYFGEGL